MSKLGRMQELVNTDLDDKTIASGPVWSSGNALGLQAEGSADFWFESWSQFTQSLKACELWKLSSDFPSKQRKSHPAINLGRNRNDSPGRGEHVSPQGPVQLSSEAE